MDRGRAGDPWARRGSLPRDRASRPPPARRRRVSELPRRGSPTPAAWRGRAGGQRRGGRRPCDRGSGSRRRSVAAPSPCRRRESSSCRRRARRCRRGSGRAAAAADREDRRPRWRPRSARRTTRCRGPGWVGGATPLTAKRLTTRSGCDRRRRTAPGREGHRSRRCYRRQPGRPRRAPGGDRCLSRDRDRCRGARSSIWRQQAGIVLEIKKRYIVDEQSAARGRPARSCRSPGGAASPPVWKRGIARSARGRAGSEGGPPRHRDPLPLIILLRRIGLEPATAEVGISLLQSRRAMAAANCSRSSISSVTASQTLP